MRRRSQNRSQSPSSPTRGGRWPTSRVPHQASARLPGPGHPMFSSQKPAPLGLTSQQTAYTSRSGLCCQVPAHAPPRFAEFQPFPGKGPQKGAGGMFLPSPLPRDLRSQPGEQLIRRERCKQLGNAWGHGDNRGCGWQRTRASLVSPNQRKGVACCEPQGRGGKGSAPPSAARSFCGNRAGRPGYSALSARPSVSQSSPPREGSCSQAARSQANTSPYGLFP